MSYIWEKRSVSPDSGEKGLGAHLRRRSDLVRVGKDGEHEGEDDGKETSRVDVIREERTTKPFPSAPGLFATEGDRTHALIPPTRT